MSCASAVDWFVPLSIDLINFKTVFTFGKVSSFSKPGSTKLFSLTRLRNAFSDNIFAKMIVTNQVSLVP